MSNKIDARDALWFTARFRIGEAGDSQKVYAVPADLVDRNSLNYMSNDIFIYRTKAFKKKVATTSDQVWARSMTLDWYVASRARLSLDRYLNIENLFIDPSMVASSYDLRPSMNFGLFDIVKLFDLNGIICTLNDHFVFTADYVSTLMGYIARDEKVNVMKLRDNVIFITEEDPEKVEDYMTNTFEEYLEDVLSYMKSGLKIDSIANILLGNSDEE